MLDDVEEIGGHQHEGAPSDQTTNRAALSSFTGAIIHMNDEEEERWLALNDHMWCEDAPKDAENDISQWVSDEGALASTSGADERLAVPLSQVAVPLSKVALATLFKSLWQWCWPAGENCFVFFFLWIECENEFLNNYNPLWRKDVRMSQIIDKRPVAKEQRRVKEGAMKALAQKNSVPITTPIGYQTSFNNANKGVNRSTNQKHNWMSNIRQRMSARAPNIAPRVPKEHQTKRQMDFK
jgi:hypothetical protein